nr:PREDICTED: basic salivary proline-rich protein 1-like [Rhinolophus sinicus]
MSGKVEASFPVLPNTKKSKGGQLEAPLGQTKSSPVQAAPSLARGPASGKREESYRVAGVPAPLTVPELALRRGPGRLRGRPPEASGPERLRGPPRAPTAPSRPGSLRTHSPTAPRGTRAPAPPTPAARWRGAEGRDDGTARALKSLSSPIGGTAWAPGLTQPARPHSTAPSGEREREGDGRAASRRGAATGPGSSRRTRRKFQDYGPQQLSSLASGPDSEGHRGPRGGGGPASPGEGVVAPRRSPRTPPAQAGVTRSRSAARPRPARPLPPEQQYLQISPGQRLVPRPSAPSPSRGHRRSLCRPAGPPPPRPKPKPPAALTGPPGEEELGTQRRRSFSDYFSLLLEFRGGEGVGGKVGRRGRQGPRRPRSGAAESAQAAGSGPAVWAAAAGVWGPGPRRRLLCCCAASSREPHIPAQEAELRTRPAPPPPAGHAPSSARARPQDTPTPPPARVAVWRAPPRGDAVRAGRGLGWGHVEG